jgi:hypothetical protein
VPPLEPPLDPPLEPVPLEPPLEPPPLLEPEAVASPPSVGPPEPPPSLKLLHAPAMTTAPTGKAQKRETMVAL